MATSAGFAFVTGASSGTGRDIACAMAEQGYDVAILGRRAEGLAEADARIAASGRRSLILIADLRDADTVRRALDAFLTWSGGRVDVVVNAAGVTGPLSPPIGEFGVEAFDEVMAVNLRAPFLILSRLLPVMRAQKSGRVVNIGGNHGLRGRAGRASYSASKWGLRGLSRSAALEAGPDNVTVNYIAPGPVAVPRMRAAWQAKGAAEGVSEDEAVDRYVQAMGVPLGRPSRPDEIVAAVMFLVGAGGRNVTGQEIVIDGGAVV